MSILIWQEVPRVLVGVGGGVGTRRYNGKSQESRTTRLPQKRLVSPLKDSFATEKTRFPPKRLVFPLTENPILPSRRPLAIWYTRLYQAAIAASEYLINSRTEFPKKEEVKKYYFGSSSRRWSTSVRDRRCSSSHV